MPRRVLLLLSQLPHDPTSGAALSMLGTARVLADAGFTVHALSSSAVEGASPLGLLPLLAARGIRAEVDRRAAVGKGRPVVRFEDRGGAGAGANEGKPITCTVLDTGAAAVKDWDFQHGTQFQKLLIRELETFEPEVVFTYGGYPAEQTRRAMCRAAGAAVVFCVKNLSYLHPLAFEHVDAVITPSRYLTELYRRRVGIESTPIAPPMHLHDVVCEPAKREPQYFTFVNPTPAKGVFFFATLADELARRAPQVPLQVIEARGKQEHLLQAGALGGIDLRRHPNLRVAPTRAVPRDVYRDAKVMLVPSLWEEPFGRIALEAMHNGVVPIVSGRGGLAEAVDGIGDGAETAAGGIVRPIASEITPEAMRPVNRGAVQGWVDEIIRLHDDAAYLAAWQDRAKACAARHSPEVVAPEYVRVFEHVRAGTGVHSTRGPATTPSPKPHPPAAQTDPEPGAATGMPPPR